MWESLCKIQDNPAEFERPKKNSRATLRPANKSNTIQLTQKPFKPEKKSTKTKKLLPKLPAHQGLQLMHLPTSSCINLNQRYSVRMALGAVFR
jgi:hypothetical protein